MVEKILIGIRKRLPIGCRGFVLHSLKDDDEVEPRDRFVVFRFGTDMADKRAKFFTESSGSVCKIGVMKIDPR